MSVAVQVSSYLQSVLDVLLERSNLTLKSSAKLPSALSASFLARPNLEDKQKKHLSCYEGYCFGKVFFFCEDKHFALYTAF